jgi:3-dehydroquinate dehydratase-2
MVAALDSPNEKMLGRRQPYACDYRPFNSVSRRHTRIASWRRRAIDIRQTNGEVERLDWVQEWGGRVGRGAIIPIVDTTPLVPLANTLRAKERPVTEQHAPGRRLGYRFSIVSEVAAGVISGLGMHGYTLARSATADFPREANA